MSVSHPMAADDFQADSDRDLQRPGQGVPAIGGDVGADATTPNAAAPSMQPEQVVVAPERLDLKSRIEFREVASELVGRTVTGAGRLVIDCAGLRCIDSAGLNVLIIVQRKAAARRIEVLLRDLNEELRALLVLTKLDDLFKLSDRTSHQARR